MSGSQLALILRDPYYTGIVKFKGQLFPGRHQPLVSKELFLKVQDVLSERAKRGQRDRVHHHYLKGLLFCERCSQRGVRSRLIFTQAKADQYSYFLCRGRQEGTCDLPYLPIAEVEAALVHRFSRLALSGEFIAEIRSRVDQVLVDGQTSERELHANLKKQLKKLEAQEERLIDLASDGSLSSKTLKERLQKVMMEQGSLRERLATTDEQLSRGAATLLTYLDLLNEPGALYRNAEDSIRRRLLEAFFDEIRLDDDNHVLVADTPSRALADLQQASMLHQSLREQTPIKEGFGDNAKAFFSNFRPTLADFFYGQKWSNSNLVGALCDYSNNRGGEATLETLQKLLESATESQRSRPAEAVLPRRIARRLDPNVVAEIVTKYNAGYSSHDLRIEYGIAQGSLLKVLRENGANLRKQGLSLAECQTANDLYNQGVGIQRIATQLDSSYSTIRTALLNAGVQLRGRLDYQRD